MQIDNQQRLEIKAMEVVAFILEQYDDEKIDKDIDLCAELVLISKLVMSRLKKRYNLDFKKNELIDYYTNRQFSKAVKLIMELADSINKYINDNEPWKQDHDTAVVTASSALEAFKILTVYLSPIIPEITNK